MTDQIRHLFEIDNGGISPIFSESNIFKIISNTFYSNGVSISPGYRFNNIFPDVYRYQNFASKIYNEVRSVHKDQMAIIEKWEHHKQVYLPPLLSILLNRCDNRYKLIDNIINLRYEYKKIRIGSFQIQKDLINAKSNKEKLQMLYEVEKFINNISSDYSEITHKSFIKRTWDIVKTGSILKSATKLVDFIIEWDEKRSLVGGLRHFTKLQNEALSDTNYYKKVSNLFGEIKPLK